MNQTQHAQIKNISFDEKTKNKKRVSVQRAVGENKRDIHEEITNSIIKAIEEGLKGSFEMPWYQSAGLPVNAHTGKAYNGINILRLWISSNEQGFKTQKWASYKQWQEMGLNVKKGETGTAIVFYKNYEKTNKDTGEAELNFVLKTSTVFNGSQVEGFEIDTPEILINKVSDLQHVETFLKNTNAKIITEGEIACFVPRLDEIRMPEKKLFTGTSTRDETEAYYSILLHELTHWTRPEKRANRVKMFDDSKKDCAFEELVAELGSSFLGAQLGVTGSGREDHAKYIESWLSALKNDKKFIFKAAAQASKAVEFLNSLQH